MTPLFAPDILAGKVVLVTGASSGLGRHFASLFARHGAVVACAARREAELARVSSAIAAEGGRAHAIRLDVRDPRSVDDALAATVAQAGRLDVVVNNAGTAITKPALETTEDEWQRVIDTNLSGAFRVARAAGQAFASAGQGGAIVNIASILAWRVAKRIPAYIASKAALVKLTEALALEFAPLHVRVNAIAPGYIVTELNREFLTSPAGDAMKSRIPQRRFGEAQDLDGAMLLLASDAGAYVTGATIAVDGGHALAWL